MAAVLSSSLPAHSPAGCSPSAVRSAVKNAVQECNIRQSDLGAAANAAVCKPPSDWVCHVRHGPLLNTLERLEHLSHRGEFAFEALDIVVDVVRHKVRPIVAITKAAIGSGIRRVARFFGRWLGTAIGAALSPCGCGAIVGGAVGLLAGALLGSVIAHCALA
jgi:hypothetical protein